MEQYLIGDVLLSWDGGGYKMQKGEFMESFRHEGSWDGERITLRGTYESLSPYRAYPLLLEKELFSVYDVDGERLLLYHWSYLRDGYGVWLDRVAQGREDAVSMDPAMDTQIPLLPDWFFGVSGLHKALLMKKRPILHASYIDVGGAAVLFTAPSETGKTTQARLWEQYAGAEVINGDRALLGERDGVWHAYGFPNCGSSDVCVNRTLPVRAIVVLRQGEENRIEPMSMGEKLRSLIAGMVLYHWDGTDVQMALAAAEQLIAKIPVVRFICRPDAQAVEVLKKYLEEEIP